MGIAAMHVVQCDCQQPPADLVQVQHSADHSGVCPGAHLLVR